ncbi:MAG TPA: chromate efflux transporter [Anaerolineaceae bacterium]|jgi:chromate transporter|nr:chromate efflux transporter [Anaerolineaceae bacterium]
MDHPDGDRSRRLREVAGLFFRLGVTAFGGPAAHIAMMHDEVVRRKKWLTDQEFLDLLGATNLIPGPNSTEMAIHLGFERAGWAGLLAGGAAFVLPSTLMVLGLGWVYQRYGSTPGAAWLLYGVKPVVIALIVQALWSLGSKAVRGRLTALVGLAAFGLFFLGYNEIALMLAGGLAVMGVENFQRWRSARLVPAVLPALPALTWLAQAAQAAAPFSLRVLFLVFFKVGFVLYGSGYVLLAFLRADLVGRLGWLTEQQLLDAVAIGQVTPGPLSTTATFIGYQLGGLPGAVLATLGMFLPSFLLVAVSNPFIPRLRSSPLAGPFLDGVNAAALGLMAAVTVQLGQDALVDPYTIALAAMAVLALFRLKVNSTWLVLGGALLGLARFLAAG